MAVASGVSLSILERQWLSTHLTGTTSTTSLNELKRQYYVGQIGGAAADVNSLNDLERQWLRKVITDNSGTPNGSELSDLWKQAIAALGFRVSQFVDENKQTFYRNQA